MSCLRRGFSIGFTISSADLLLLPALVGITPPAYVGLKRGVSTTITNTRILIFGLDDKVQGQKVTKHCLR